MRKAGEIWIPQLSSGTWVWVCTPVAAGERQFDHPGKPG